MRRSTRSKGGRPPFDAVLMFKVLVLQTLYNLSDDQTEYQIRGRLSFMRFLGLDLHQRIPDAKTIWLFCEALAQAGVVDTLFTKFDSYLAAQGFQAHGSQPIDACLIPVPKQRNTHEENTTVKTGDCPTRLGRPADEAATEGYRSPLDGQTGRESLWLQESCERRSAIQTHSAVYGDRCGSA